MELVQSRNYWIRIVQKAWFDTELKLISKGNQLSKSNSMVRLIPFIDTEGLLQDGGRLHNAQMDSEAKHPFILPKESPLTSLIIDDAHHRTLHGGTQVTLDFLRSTYWILGGRVPVRKFILKCVRCARYRRLRAKQLMDQLPTTRVTRPFYNTGVDYAGPFTLKTWRGQAARSYKGYLAMFVCFATSAVHIEVVTDYTTDAFSCIQTLHRQTRYLCNFIATVEPIF